jgi:hypothetical protein
MQESVPAQSTFAVECPATLQSPPLLRALTFPWRLIRYFRREADLLYRGMLVWGVYPDLELEGDAMHADWRNRLSRTPLWPDVLILERERRELWGD